MSDCCQAEPPPPATGAGGCCGSKEKSALSSSWFAFGSLLLAGGLAMTLSLAVNLDPPTGTTRIVLHGLLASLSLAAILVFGRPVLARAFRRAISLETLFFVAIVGTYAASVYSSLTGTGHIYYEVVVILLAIHCFGQLIKSRQRERAREWMENVPGLREQARIRNCSGQTETVPVSRVQPGDRIEVHAGETSPVDGVIISGGSFIEEMAHTGEPFPRPRGEHEPILAGARVLDGDLLIEASVAGDAREIDRLVASLESVPESRAESTARRVLGGFVPAVLLVAAGTFIVWWALLGRLDEAIFHALAVTIVACPCGLGLAIPLAARRAHLRLQLLGLEPRDGEFLDRLAEADCSVFDKTGTLSHPRLRLGSLQCVPGAPGELRSWIAAIQRRSTHPVARPFWTLADPAALENLAITVLPARGIEARFRDRDGERVVTIGNDLLNRELARDEVTEKNPGPHEKRGLHIFVDGKKAATARLEEDPRAAAERTLTRLRRRGPVVLLTGDSAVPSFYRDLVDEAKSGLTSAEKAALVAEYQAEGRRVLFVGDGLNDAEALRSAHVSVGLASGASIAPEAADATLEHDDLAIIPRAIEVAKAARSRLQRLLAFVLIYNTIGISIAALGLLHPVMAALLMLGSSATAIGMSMHESEPDARAAPPSESSSSPSLSSIENIHASR